MGLPSCTKAYRIVATLTASLLLLAPAPGVAQSLGEIARQERERREKLKRHATRVFTNEDLAKPRILDPLDSTRLIVAPGQAVPLPPDLTLEMTIAEPVSADSLGVGLPPNVSLGDVARYYRLKKVLSEDALASRLRQSLATTWAQAGQTAPTIATAPATTVAGSPAIDPFPVGPGTPKEIVLGDVARSNRQQGSVRVVPRALPQNAGLAPKVPTEPLGSIAPAPGADIGIVAQRHLSAPGLPESSGRPLLPVIPAGAGIPPEISLADVARQSRHEQAKSWTTQPEGSLRVPTDGLSTARVSRQPGHLEAPDAPEVISPAAAEMPTSHPASALTVFSAPEPAPNQRSLRVVKLTESDVLAATTLVEVKRGDSLWRIAAQHLGNGRRWREIHANNPEILNPNVIRVGEVIRVPHQALAERRREFNVVLVRAGDTLWGLAALEFGRGDAWSCIARANPQLHDPNRILPGQELIRPDACSEAL